MNKPYDFDAIIPGKYTALSDFKFDESADRLEELHRAITEGVSFHELTAEDQKLLMDDVDAAMADALQDLMIYNSCQI